MKMPIFIGAGVVIILASFIALIYSGLYLQIIGDRYEKIYNDERIRQGQPIIEEYFVKKPKKDKQLMVWSDTTNLHAHTDKSYYLNDLGTLQYEIDYYKPPYDTKWLVNQLNLAKHDTLVFLELQRIFYLRNKEISYQISFKVNGQGHKTMVLDVHKGDSLYRTLANQ